ncbi:MAG TPA: hypothetical protein VMZ66_07005 [Aeromicrobium sp.]|nr:hypothetical protein [Aeromicrobium sp.]
MRICLRHIGLGRIGLAVLLSLASLAACGPSPEDVAACRKQFADHQQLLGENGNPGRKDFTPKMTARWDALYAEFGRLGKSATADDCPGRFRAMKAETSDLESVLYKIDDYDVARMTRGAEADLDHAGGVGRSYSTDYVLITLFRTLRERGADAEKVLAPIVARVDAAKPDDTSERAAAMVALYNASASNAAFADFKEALESIKDYELDEE